LQALANFIQMGHPLPKETVISQGMQHTDPPWRPGRLARRCSSRCLSR